MSKESVVSKYTKMQLPKYYMILYDKSIAEILIDINFD